VRPAVVILGFVLGSAAAITFSLAGTLVVFRLLLSEHPRLEAELSPLAMSALSFAALTAAAGASFYGEIKRRRWRRAAVVAMVLALAAVAVYHALR
jgi:hypothetical protein